LIKYENIANHHDRDLVTPAHENHPLSPQRGGRESG
jgi:hypothetical protein